MTRRVRKPVITPMMIVEVETTSLVIVTVAMAGEVAVDIFGSARVARQLDCM